MKKLLFLLISVALITASCSKSNDEDDERTCWQFTLKQTTTAKQNGTTVSGYPKTVTTKSTQCNLTESEAESVRKAMQTTSSSSSGGIQVTITTTATKQKLNDYQK